jgi:uncharacterized membrane protein YhaH (DUF805 family)
VDLLLRPWRRYAEFDGRARRSEYLLFWIMVSALTFLWLFIFGIAAAVAAEATSGADSALVPLIVLAPVGLFWLIALVPSIAVTVRRMHDQDQSGWLTVLTWLPFVGWIFVLVFGFIPGTAGGNRFGPDPRGGVQHLERVFG